MKPLTRYFGEWRENVNKIEYLYEEEDDFWYREKDIREALEWLMSKVENKETKGLISCAFPEVWFSKRRGVK